MALTFRVCTTNEDYKRVADLEMLVWDVEPRDTITTHTMHVLTRTGGVVMGAFDGDMMVGFVVAFAMREQEQLWSHATAVHPDYQGQRIGAQLKQAQRQWALENGYTQMRWTFDPAMRQNANFNFNHLGVIVNTYHVNFYGMMSDGLNAGVTSDRFEAIWNLQSQITKPVIHTETSFLLKDNDGIPEVQSEPTDQYHFVSVPYDFMALKSDNLALAIKWRDAMREVLQSAFMQGYWALDFTVNHDTQACWYIIRKH